MSSVDLPTSESDLNTGADFDFSYFTLTESYDAIGHEQIIAVQVDPSSFRLETENIDYPIPELSTEHYSLRYSETWQPEFDFSVVNQTLVF